MPSLHAAGALGPTACGVLALFSLSALFLLPRISSADDDQTQDESCPQEEPDEDCHSYVVSATSPRGGWGPISWAQTSQNYSALYVLKYEALPLGDNGKVICVATRIDWVIDNETGCAHNFTFALVTSGTEPPGSRGTAPNPEPAWQGTVCVPPRTKLRIGNGAIAPLVAHGAHGAVYQLKYPTEPDQPVCKQAPNQPPCTPQTSGPIPPLWNQPSYALPPSRPPARCRCIENHGKAEKDRLDRQGDDFWERARRQIQRRANADEDFLSRMTRIVRLVYALEDEAVKKLGALRQELLDMEAARDRDLDEMRRGYFCSKCLRSASEIEAEEHIPFEQHLANVQGEPIPATQEQLDAKAAELDEPIREKYNEYVDAYNEYVQRDNDLRQQYDRLAQERANAWNEATREILDLKRRADKDYDEAAAVHRMKHLEAAKCVARNTNGR